MGYFRYHHNLEPIHESVQTLLYNIVSRIMMGLPRSFYNKIPDDVPIINTFKLFFALPVLKIAGVNPWVATLALFILFVIFSLISAKRMEDDFDQMYFNRNFNITKQVEDKLVSMTPDSHRLSFDDMKKATEDYGEEYLEKMYKSRTSDGSIIGVFTHSMAYHVVQRGQYVYIYFFEFDNDEIFRCVSPFILDKGSDNINTIGIEEIKGFDKIDPSLYKVGE